MENKTNIEIAAEMKKYAEENVIELPNVNWAGVDGYRKTMKVKDKEVCVIFTHDVMFGRPHKHLSMSIDSKPIEDKEIIDEIKSLFYDKAEKVHSLPGALLNNSSQFLAYE